jgi:hypothetical protein
MMMKSIEFPSWSRGAHLVSTSLCRFALLLLLVVLTTGCPPWRNDTSTRATIDADGGELEVETENGAVLLLQILEDSVGDEVEIALTPLPPSERAWMRVEVNPSGQELWKPAEFEVAVPDDVVLTELTTLAFGNGETAYPIPTEVDFAGRMLYASTYSLGYAFEDGKQTGDTGNFNVVEALDSICENASQTGVKLVQLALDMVNLLELVPDLERAEALHSLIDTLTENAVECVDDSDPEALYEKIRMVSCEQYKEARAAAVDPDLELEDFLDFKRRFVPLAVWAGEAEAIGGVDCGGGANPTGADLVETSKVLYENLVLHLDSLAGTMDPADFEALREEAKSLMELAGGVASLGLEEEADELLTDVFSEVIVTLRDLAYQMSRTNKDVVWLSLATSASLGIPPGVVGLDEEILEDIQYCLTTDVAIVSKDGDDSELGKLEGLGGGAMPGMVMSTGMLPITEDGKLTISGKLLGFQCDAMPDPVDAEDEILIRLNGSRVRTLSKPNATGDFLGNDVNLDVSQMFSMVPGLTFTGGESYTLTIVRMRPELGDQAGGVEYCPPETYGEREYELFTIELNAQSDTSAALHKADYNVRAKTEVTDYNSDGSQRAQAEDDKIIAKDNVPLSTSSSPITIETNSGTANLPNVSTTKASAENVRVDVSGTDTITVRVRGDVKASTKNLRNDNLDQIFLFGYVAVDVDLNFSTTLSDGSRVNQVMVTGTVMGKADESQQLIARAEIIGDIVKKGRTSVGVDILDVNGPYQGGATDSLTKEIGTGDESVFVRLIAYASTSDYDDEALHEAELTFDFTVTLAAGGPVVSR